MSPDTTTRGRHGEAGAPTGDHAARDVTEQVVALAEEVLHVSKRTVETGRVRISLSTETAEDVLRDTLRTRRAEIERVQIDCDVSEPPRTRQEGDVLVVPVVEEIFVVERRLVLREEIRLRLVDGEKTVEQSVERRVQRATVDRVPAAGTTLPAARMDT